ncbi:MAG TPA: cobalamin-independent methionine synthase II family protein [Candidatus Sulfotelmatobacter sp.]|nr:cobalamin-independent methionine synthase II family protein [Candidatus Sulfotelmatobacter sp.]
MDLQRSRERILTTHVGSLPRPKDLLDRMKAKLAGAPHDAVDYDARVRQAVADCVRRQADSGIDILTDGEQSKPGFYTYVRERLTGFEARPERKRQMFAAEVAAFPEYYAQYFKQAMLGGAIAPAVPLLCTGPVGYCGAAALRRDIDNLAAAVAQLPAGRAPHAVFMPAVAPSGVGENAYYPSDAAYFEAVGAALAEEYRAIVDAGFVLQIDDPFLSDLFGDPAYDARQRHERAEMYVASVNRALRGIPPERVRYHTCYGINHGPRIHEAALADVVDHVLAVDAIAYSFEAANPRHEHEYHLWETVKLPPGKILVPGVITHASNIVEHPELIAERIVRFARLVGRENVVAGADCGFSSQATYATEVRPWCGPSSRRCATARGSPPGSCGAERRGSAADQRAEAVGRDRRGGGRARLARRIGEVLVGAHRDVGALVGDVDRELRLGVGHRAVVVADRNAAVVELHQRIVLARPVVEQRHRLVRARGDQRLAAARAALVHQREQRAVARVDVAPVDHHLARPAAARIEREHATAQRRERGIGGDLQAHRLGLGQALAGVGRRDRRGRRRRLVRGARRRRRAAGQQRRNDRRSEPAGSAHGAPPKGGTSLRHRRHGGHWAVAATD